MLTRIAPRNIQPRREKIAPSFRGRLLCAVVAGLIAGAAATAEARDMTGKAGLGFSGRLVSTLKGSAPALTFRYWRETFAIELIAGFDWDIDRNRLRETRQFNGGFGVLYRIYDVPRVSAAIGGRIFVQGTTSEVEADSVLVTSGDNGQVRVLDELSSTSFLFDLVFAIPLQVEFFLSDHSSLTASVGISFVASSGGNGSVANGSTPMPRTAGGRIELSGRHSGGIGYTYYF